MVRDKVFIGVIVYMLVIAGAVVAWGKYSGYADACAVITTPATIAQDMNRCIGWWIEFVKRWK